ncbi:MAG: hypothetical protein OEZ15_01245 [Gammaproteobacteria bacterium]|nr:hypothetical protein [Gammaproteobacteria bacterium]
MLRKTKLSSAVVIALATTVSVTMLTGLTGCKLNEGGTSITGGQTSTINNPRGTVVGNVQDTNGNPIANADVYLAGQKVRTDMGGNYRFNSVPVTNTTGTGSDTSNGTLVVTVVPPAGYLGATVTVTPEAQMNNNGDNGGGSINPVSAFIDGFIASAGTAVVPGLTSTVTGVLRNSTSQEPIPNTLVSLDLVNVTGGANAQESASNGTTAGYQTFAYTATTAADGSFTISNVPNDSQLRFEVEGHSFVSIAYNAAGNNVETSGEDVSTNVGNLLVSVDTQDDTAAPYVVRVEGVQDQNAGTGQLNDDIDGTTGLVIHFSEAMDGAQVDANSVALYDTSNGAYIAVTSATMAADGRSMTITTATAIPAAANFDINFLRADFMDLAGNSIAAVAAANDVGFDSVITSAANATDTYRLNLRVFQQLNTNANAVTLAQLTTDATGSDDDAAVQASNAAFADVRDANDGFQQLNSSDDDDTLNGSDAGERLNALVVASGGTSLVADVARIDFTPDNASYYEVTIVDENGVANNAAVITLDSNPDGATLTDLGGNTFEISALNGSTATIEMVVAGVAVGDVVEITPFDDWGYAGASNTVTLTDQVPPTAVLQNSYNTAPGTGSQVVSVTFGNGGELSNIGSSIVGLPILNVTPQLLDNMETDGAGGSQTVNVDGVADNNLIYELIANGVVDPATGLPYLAGVALNATDPYDATAYAAMNLARTMGFNMSEDVTVSADAAFTGTNASLTNFVESNDVTVNDAGATVNVDLVLADVDDVFKLAADDNSVVDFAGVIADNSGNVAVDASVVINDLTPPMVVSAVYDGTSIVVTFNEPVNMDLAVDTLTIGGMSFGLTNASFNATNTVLTILPEDDTWVAPATAGNATGAWIDETGLGNAALLDGYANLNRGAVFSLAQYPETAVAYTVQGISNTEGHALLTYNSIEDAHGNTWVTNSAGVTYTGFAAIDATGAFEVVTGPAAPAAGATTASLTYTFTHPLDVATVFGACATPGLVTETNGNFSIAGGTAGVDGVANCFTSTSGAVTSTGASYTAATKTLTVNLGFPAVVSTDAIAMIPATVGEYDSVDTFVTAAVVVP